MVKTRASLQTCSILAAGICALLVAMGCESDDNDSPQTAVPESSTSTPLVLSPVSVSFNAPLATNITFTASGGGGGYAWAVADPSVGTLVSSGATAIYSSTTNAGQNSVTVTDSTGSSVSANINQN